MDFKAGDIIELHPTINRKWDGAICEVVKPGNTSLEVIYKGGADPDLDDLIGETKHVVKLIACLYKPLEVNNDDIKELFD